MINQAIGSLAGLAIAAAVFTLTPARAADWVPIKGKVRLADGTPICAMVLANGQYMFSCGGDGAYSLNVPLDNKGQVTLFAFADGFAPFRVTAAPGRLPSTVRTRTAEKGSPLIAMTRAAECGANNWVRISGEIESFGGSPLCAMVLANGQHMFSCGASQGRYDLTVPADENGNITVFGFADGFQPYSETFVAPECDTRYATADGVRFEYRLVNKVISTINYCHLEATATNTTTLKKQCFLKIDAYDSAGRYLAWGIVLFKLPPKITDSDYSALLNDSSVVSRCDTVGSWELSDDPLYDDVGGFPFCLDGF